MLFKSIINKVVRHVQEHPDSAGAQAIQRIADSRGQTVDSLFRTMQVQDITQLRQILPEVFPKKLRSGPLVATTNIYNVWRIDPLTGNGQKWQVVL